MTSMVNETTVTSQDSFEVVETWITSTREQLPLCGTCSLNGEVYSFWVQVRGKDTASLALFPELEVDSEVQHATPTPEELFAYLSSLGDMGTLCVPTNRLLN